MASGINLSFICFSFLLLRHIIIMDPSRLPLWCGRGKIGSLVGHRAWRLLSPRCANYSASEIHAKTIKWNESLHCAFTPSSASFLSAMNNKNEKPRAHCQQRMRIEGNLGNITQLGKHETIWNNSPGIMDTMLVVWRDTKSLKNYAYTILERLVRHRG